MSKNKNNSAKKKKKKKKKQEKDLHTIQLSINVIGEKKIKIKKNKKP